MSHFYANIKGNRGEATRGGSKESGMYAHIRGWDVGCRVYLSHDGNRDMCSVFITSGSNGRTRDIHLGTFYPSEDKGDR
jgi:hypothetical protein